MRLEAARRYLTIARDNAQLALDALGDAGIATSDPSTIAAREAHLYAESALASVEQALNGDV